MSHGERKVAYQRNILRRLVWLVSKPEPNVRLSSGLHDSSTRFTSKQERVELGWPLPLLSIIP